MTAKKAQRLEILKRLKRNAEYIHPDEAEALGYAVRLIENLSKGGRKRKLSTYERSLIVAQRQTGETVLRLAQHNGVSESTIRRVLEEEGID